jgi:hypothetical protein
VKWPLRAAMDVYFVAGVGISLGLLQLLLDYIRYRRNPEVMQKPVESSNLHVRYLEAAAWIAGTLAGIVLIGFHITFFVVPLAYARTHGGSWRVALTLGILSELVLVGLFDSLIRVVWQQPLLIPFPYPPDLPFL